MTIKDLKMSLSRLPGDLDDVEVFVNFVDDNLQQGYDYLAFTAYSELPVEEGTVVYMLGTEKAAIVRMKNGTLHNRDGSVVENTDELNEQ